MIPERIHQQLDSGCPFCKHHNAAGFSGAFIFPSNSDCQLIACPECCVIYPLFKASRKITDEDQALFHEALFDIEGMGDFLQVPAQLANMVLYDYPIYFGNKESELICEVGAGRGSFIKALRDIGYTAIGCEYSEGLVKAGRSAYDLPENVFFQLNAWDLPTYLSCGNLRPTIIILWHVIEHIENSIGILESLIKSCADKITLLFQTPLPVPEYIFPEHLFFPSTETYHYIAERLGLKVKLLYVIPYTRYVTCVLSNKDVPEGKIYPKQRETPGFSVTGQLIAQLDAGLEELDQVTKEQYENIVRLESQVSPLFSAANKPLTLASDLSKIADFLRTKSSSDNTLLDQKMEQLAAENHGLRNELLRAEAQLVLLTDVLLNNLDDHL